MSTIRSRGRPYVAPLKVGIALSLVMPGPAWAAAQPEDQASEWRTESAVKLKPKAAEADAAASEPAAPASAAPAKKKSKKSGAKKATVNRAALIKEAVEKAEADRQPLQEEAQRLSEQGNLEGAVGLLAGGAEALRDPVLHLAAADVRQKIARKRSAQEAVADWEASVRHCEKAEALLNVTDATPPEAFRVAPEETEAIRAWGSELRGNAQAAIPELRKATNPVRRNARGELIAGSILLAGGVAGLSVMAGGLWLNGQANRVLDQAEGMPGVDLGPIEAQKKQGETMIAAGAVAGALGVVLGVTLVALGARDLKAARSERLSRVRVLPTFGGIALSGRF